MKPLPGLLIVLCVAALMPAQAQVPNKDGTLTPRSDAGKPIESKPGVRWLPGLSITISPSLLFRSTQPDNRESFEPGQLLVSWDDEAAAREGLAWLVTQGLQPTETRTLEQLGLTLALFVLPDARAAQRWRDELRRAQPQWTVDLNARAYPMQRDAAVAPSAAPARLYALQMLGRPGTVAGASLPRVGVVDAPLDAALLTDDAARLWNGSRLELRNMLGALDLPAASTHANAVALLMAGAPLDNGYVGAAPPLQLSWAVAMRRVGDEASTNSWYLALSLDWLLGREVQLINLSLGGAGDQILRSVVARLLARPVALLAAAGNRPDAAPVYPAAYPGVWAVTAVDAAGQVYERASRGSFISLAAPGVDLWVPDAASLLAAPPRLAGRYVSGTSFATALASATVARFPLAFWQLGADARKARLCALARPAAAADASTGCGVLRFDDAAWAAAVATRVP